MLNSFCTLTPSMVHCPPPFVISSLANVLGLGQLGCELASLRIVWPSPTYTVVDSSISVSGCNRKEGSELFGALYNEPTPDSCKRNDGQRPCLDRHVRAVRLGFVCWDSGVTEESSASSAPRLTLGRDLLEKRVFPWLLGTCMSRRPVWRFDRNIWMRGIVAWLMERWMTS